MTSLPANTLAAQPALQKQIEALGPWFHNLHLPTGEQTAPDHWLGDFPRFKWSEMCGHIPDDLSGWKVLDVGCNGGFYAIELARRGADVLAIDIDSRYLNQARWAVQQFGLADKVRFQQMQVYDLAHTGETFDLVWFMGVFYHLRYPLLGLEIVTQKTDGLLMFQTLTAPGDELSPTDADLPLKDRERLNERGWPRMAFIEHRLAGDPTNWWAPNRACVEAMLRYCQLEILSRPAHETYLCRRTGEGRSSPVNEEYAAVLGLPRQI